MKSPALKSPLYPPSRIHIPSQWSIIPFGSVKSVSNIKVHWLIILSGKNPNEYHASDFRYMIGEAATNPVAKRLLESFIGEGNINALFATFGLPNDLGEISGMALGSATLGVGTKRKKLKKVKNNKKQRESNNLNLVDDIMRLIMERGIMQWIKKKKSLEKI